jgi:hypothetical protein
VNANEKMIKEQDGENFTSCEALAESVTATSCCALV